MVDEHGEAVVDWSSQAEDPALQTELRMVLTAAIESLPEDYRTVVVLRDVEGLSMHEIAETTGLSVASVKVRAHRARLVLRKRLGAYLSGPPTRVTACERTGEENKLLPMNAARPVARPHRNLVRLLRTGKTERPSSTRRIDARSLRFVRS
jgi:hypothetical protein